MLNLLALLAMADAFPPGLLLKATLLWSLAVAVLVILLSLILVRATFRVGGVIGAAIAIVLLVWFVF